MSDVAITFIPGVPSNEIIADFPAYTIIKMPIWRQENMRHGDEFAIPFQSRSHGILWHFFKLGSVFGCAVADGRDVIAAYERTKKLGHKVHWANAQAVAITAWKQEKRTVWGLDFGSEISFEGIRFRLEKAPNDNISLIEIKE